MEAKGFAKDRGGDCIIDCYIFVGVLVCGLPLLTVTKGKCNMENITPQYAAWLADWKKRIQSAQIKAALSVNRELLLLYWELGHDIALKQETTAWGQGLIPRFAKDLKAAFPHLTGFSRTNLFYIQKWYFKFRFNVC